MNIFLGDEITLTKQSAWVTGTVTGIKLDKGHLEMLALEHMTDWFRIDQGWRIVKDDEETELND